MKKFLFIVETLFLISMLSIFPQSKGHLVIIGGGDKTTEIMQTIVDFAGGVGR